eukprot:6458031-Amphidinium_carterae.4
MNAWTKLDLSPLTPQKEESRDVCEPLEMDCAPIVSSGCSPSVSIGAAAGVVDAPDCPADLVGTCAVGDVGLADVDGLNVADCGGGGDGAFILGCCIVLIVAPAPTDNTLTVNSDCASCTLAKLFATPVPGVEGMPAIIANDSAGSEELSRALQQPDNEDLKNLKQLLMINTRSGLTLSHLHTAIGLDAIRQGR